MYLSTQVVATIILSLMEKAAFPRNLAIGLAIAIVILVLVRLFALDVLVVDGPSMQPTIMPGAVVLVNRLAYGLPSPLGGYLLRWAPIREGDILVFRSPDGRTAVKRCHAVWGQVSEYAAWAPGTIVALGDNPESSWDSRSYGPIEEASVLGKVAGYR